MYIFCRRKNESEELDSLMKAFRNNDETKVKELLDCGPTSTEDLNWLELAIRNQRRLTHYITPTIMHVHNMAVQQLEVCCI